MHWTHRLPDSRPSPVPDVTGHPKCDNDIEKQRTYKDFKSLRTNGTTCPASAGLVFARHTSRPSATPKEPFFANPQRQTLAI